MLSPWVIAMSAIGAIFVLVFVVFAIRRHCRRQYFLSNDYVASSAKILRFAVEFRQLRSALNKISDPAKERLKKLGGPSAAFLSNSPYSLPDDVSSALKEYGCLDSVFKQHDKEVEFANRFSIPVRELMESSAYVSYNQIGLLSEDAKSLYEVLQEHQADILFGETREGLQTFITAEKLRMEHNHRFVESELERCDTFFRTIAHYSLDRQQRECCVVDDDSMLVVAGAGSGKTSVIMAKVAYLVNERGVDPSEILLISYTNKAAGEMTERIAQCLPGNGVKAMTFHKFGMELIRASVDMPYDIADETKLQRLAHKMMTGAGDVVPGGYDLIIKYFAYYFNADQTSKNDESLGEKIDRERTLNLETLKSMTGACATGAHDGHLTLGGERVKSFEEVLIANFLFLNGIDYEYESKYPKEYVDDGHHRIYRPDFHLVTFDVYLEHYGVDRAGNPPPYFSDVEKKKYKEGMDWKRRLHREHGNKYVESFSWWSQENVLFKNLEAALRNVGVKFQPRDSGEVWRMLCEKAKHQLDEFEKLIVSFISLYKSNGFCEGHFDELLKLKAATEHDTERQRVFLKIVRDVYVKYQKSLQVENAYDFNDMIGKSTEIVNGLDVGSLPFKYIIIDEYQDASMGRMRLLDAVVKKTGAHLFCVGDDWQSIFRFAGSDINLFTHFSDFFGTAAVTMKIENTYRNSQDLIDIMGWFVMKNPDQIRKALKSKRSYVNPIRPIRYNQSVPNEYENALSAALGMIASETKGHKSSVMLLGRTKYDEQGLENHPILRKTGEGRYDIRLHPELSCQFLTVHKSKGLEADYVILLNAKNSLLGFPNLIADDPILQIVLSAPEPYDYAEERRLFYVALTRTRNAVFILMPEKLYSPFMDDLFERGVKPITLDEGVNQDEDIHCPKCKKGILVRKSSRRGTFTRCSNFPYCDYSVPFQVSTDSMRCPLCGGFLLRRLNRRDGNAFWGCSNYPICNYTKEIEGAPYSGYLRRQGRESSYGYRKHHWRGD